MLFKIISFTIADSNLFMQSFTLLKTLLFLSIFFNLLFAQTFDSLSIGNINARINSNGSFFWDKSGKPKFEFPKGSNKHATYVATTWMGGYDSGGLLRVAAQTYKQAHEPIVAGPIRNVQFPIYDSLYNQKYNKVWKITKSQIDYHKNNYGNLGYIPSTNVLNWPGNGDINQGEHSQLAPYFDSNNDQIYNPLSGDYPLIKGDEALFIMYHDEKSDSSLNFETKALFYVYTCDSILQNTIFAEFKLTNTNSFAINNFKFASWNDFDLGYFYDDYFGSDSLNNFFYVYNGDQDDNGAPGYGSTPPALGVVFLNNPMTNFINYKSDYSDSVNFNFTEQIYNYMNSKWINGQNLTYGGNGLDSSGIQTTHMFTGFPEDTIGWTEFNVSNEPYDRRGLGSTSYNVFQPNETIQIDLAYVISRGTDHLNSLRKLRTDVNHVKDKYLLQGCYPVSIQKPSDSFLFSIYPNPTNSNYVTLKGLESDNYELYINNNLGQNVWKTNLQANQYDVKIPDLENGIYFIHLKNSDGKIANSKLLIMK